MNDDSARLLPLLTNIMPVDALEAEHLQDVLQWVQSGVNPYRIAKPDNPPKHLVSYFVPYDPTTRQFMLIDHKLAQAWLPPGGHVEMNEDPKQTVIREAQEELLLDAQFTSAFGDVPVFITVTQTKGAGSHIDVSLWYVIVADSKQSFTFDEREMGSYKWLTAQQILDTEVARLDPHLHRFVNKVTPSL